MVGELGFDVLLALRYPDHHRYTKADAEAIARTADSADASAVVVTEKDAVKLRPIWGYETPLLTCVLEMTPVHWDPVSWLAETAKAAE